MAGLLQAARSAERPFLWLDLCDYAGRLLAGGSIPWLDSGAYLLWRRKAHSLLPSDVVSLPLARVCAAWIGADPRRAEAMGVKSRRVFPLKTLLADTALRAHLLELTGFLRSSFATPCLALVAPAPQAWAAMAHALAFRARPDFDLSEDEVESAAVYLADFLRTFSASGIDALLLDASGCDVTPPALPSESWKPLWNLAGHYRWDAGVLLGDDVGAALRGSGIDFAVASQGLDVPTGVSLPKAFWTGAAAPELRVGDFRYATIPADASPEGVLAQLSRLRGAA